MRYEVQSKAGLRHRGYNQLIDFKEGVTSQPASLVSLSCIALDAPNLKKCAKEFLGVVLEIFGHCSGAI